MELDTYVSDDDILEATPIDTVSESKWWTSTIEGPDEDGWDWDDWTYWNETESQPLPLSCYVDQYGNINNGEDGETPDEELGVRPAIWVKLN